MDITLFVVFFLNLVTSTITFVLGSEDNFIYLWRTGYYPSSSPSCVQKDKNTNWERFRTDTSNSIVTAAVFSPKPQLILSFLEEESRRESHKNTSANNTPREQELKKDADVKKRFPFRISIHEAFGNFFTKSHSLKIDLIPKLN